jgi:methylthioribulose-1-phosphate dehydratase
MFSEKDLIRSEELIQAILFFNKKGWSPATSTNYSIRSSNTCEYIISQSGVDKSQFSSHDLIVINSSGKIIKPTNGEGLKSSAETEIHTAIYELYPEVNCVLHTHSVLGTILSQVHLKNGLLEIEGLELLKAFEGNKTHELTEIIPIVPNSQDISEIVKNIIPQLRQNSRIHGFLIAGHGLYTWGKDVATAKRHIEAYEFLFECIYAMRSI